MYWYFHFIVVFVLIILATSEIVFLCSPLDLNYTHLRVSSVKPFLIKRKM